MDIKKIVKKVLPWVIYLLVGMFIFVTLRDNYEEVKHYRIESPYYLIGAVLLFTAQFGANALIWSKLMEYVGEKIPTWDSVQVYISSFIIRYIPGNVWAIAARAAMNRDYGVKITSSIWGWMIENVSYLFVGLCFGLLALVGIDGIPREFILVVAVSIPACAVFLFRYSILERLVRKIIKSRFPQVKASEVGKFDISLQRRVVLLCMFIISWILFSFQFVLVALAVSDVSPGEIFFLGGVNALAWSIGYISIITPSGTGVRESVIILTLTAFGIVGEVDAITIALLARLTAVAGEVLLFGGVKFTNFLIKSR